MNALGNAKFPGYLLQPAEHVRFVRPNKGKMQILLGDDAVLQNIREGAKQKAGTFFLRKATQKKNQPGLRGDLQRGAKGARSGKSFWNFNAIAPKNNFFARNSAGFQFGLFLLRSRNHGGGSGKKLAAPELVVNSF